MKIVFINGSAESGKDSVVKIVQGSGLFYIYNYSTIDPCREATDALGIPREPKDETLRSMLSDLKDIWSKYYDGPFKYIRVCLSTSRIIKKSHPIVSFVHSREPKELTRFKKKYPKSITLLVRRPGYSLNSNHADANVEKFDYDYYIENDGSYKDLIKKVDIFIKEKLA